MVIIVENRHPASSFTTISPLMSQISLEISENVTSFKSNSTRSISRCDLQPENPWCGQFGIQQYIEVVYLGIITVFGLFGNLVLIASILFEKKLHKNANIFVVNLAIADLLAAGIYTPIVIANVIKSESALPLIGCQIFGYLIIVACSASMWNLALIAMNRYIAITHTGFYVTYFSKRKSYYMVIYTWVFSIILASPTTYGWTTLKYDFKSMVCAWDDTATIYFTLFLIFGAIFIPLIATIFCYWKLFTVVKNRNRESFKIIANTQTKADVDMRKNTLQKEISLLKTLATALFVFVIFWTPYAFCSLINPATVDPQIKKVATWFGLNNSALNFIIYGVMNDGYRNGYKKLFAYIFCRRNAKILRRQSTYRSHTRSHGGV